MSFSELTFLFLFLPAVVIPYCLLSKLKQPKIKDIWLLLVNGCFYLYAGSKTFVAFLYIVLLTFILGNLVYSTRENKSQKKWIVFSMLVLTGILFYYRLLQPTIGLINRLAGSNFSVRDIIAPLGISFLVFECVSYVVDIYRGDATPGTFIDAVVFLSFFPKLLSGPIVLWKDYQPQIQNRKCDSANISRGIDRIIIGYAKKVIIADSFAATIAAINSGIASSGADVPMIWIKYILFFFRIYYDFSGYSDIAIGLCKLFGFDIKENFRYPYMSTSISEFWRGWHISLGTWFREYIYIPLGGNRKGNVYLHLLIVFALTGIWHGAGEAFLIWGLLNGAFVMIEKAIRNCRWYMKIPNIIKWFFTTLIVFFLWIIFSSACIQDIMDNISGLFHSTATMPLNFTWQYYLTRKTVILLIIALIGSAAGVFNSRKGLLLHVNGTAATVVKRILLLILFVLVIVFMVNKSYSPFIYFRF